MAACYSCFLNRLGPKSSCEHVQLRSGLSVPVSYLGTGVGVGWVGCGALCRDRTLKVIEPFLLSGAHVLTRDSSCQHLLLGLALRLCTRRQLVGWLNPHVNSVCQVKKIKRKQRPVEGLKTSSPVRPLSSSRVREVYLSRILLLLCAKLLEKSKGMDRTVASMKANLFSSD